MAFALGDICLRLVSEVVRLPLSPPWVYELGLVLGLSDLTYFGQDRPESPGSMFPESRPG